MKPNNNHSKKINWKVYLKVLVLMIVVWLVSAYSDRINLRDYKEECYEYRDKTVTFNVTFTEYEPRGCNAKFCISCFCKVVNRTYTFNTIQGKSDECLKYHLVRYP